MPRYTVSALVPDPLAFKISALRRQLDTFTRQWLPPHITIVPPFELDLTREEIQAVKSLPVDVTVALEGWGEFRRDRTSVIFQKLPATSFDAVRSATALGVPRLAVFIPQDSEYHVTIVSRIPNEVFDEVQAKVTAKALTGSFTVNHVTVYEWDDELRRWIEVSGYNERLVTIDQ
jgi:2'-5' RNA ligase